MGRKDHKARMGHKVRMVDMGMGHMEDTGMDHTVDTDMDRRVDMVHKACSKEYYSRDHTCWFWNKNTQRKQNNYSQLIVTIWRNTTRHIQIG